MYLKGGGKSSGRIVVQSADRIVIDIGDGTVGFSMDRVEEIEKGPSPLDEFEARAGKLGPQGVDGWRGLAQWATMKGLSRQSRLAWEKVLAAAPDDAEARRALGYVRLDGREAVDGHDAWKLTLTLRSGGVLFAFLDVKSANLIRTEVTRQVRGKPVRIETTFGDYRRTGGILFPHLVEVRAAGRPQFLRIAADKVEVNPP